MTHSAAAAAEPRSKGAAWVGWILTGVILLSFGFGVAMYLSPEQRAQKFSEIKQKYEAKQQYRIASGNRK
jgi:hypothetical protein